MCRFSSLLTVSWLQVADPRAKAAGQDLKGHSRQPAKQLLADAIFFLLLFRGRIQPDVTMQRVAADVTNG
jgi:hypothetical protein